MARIPTDELERLKAGVSVERLVEASGVALRAVGKGRCPFHEDREASLVVTPGKNLWHCFSCQIGGVNGGVNFPTLGEVKFPR